MSPLAQAGDRRWPCPPGPKSASKRSSRDVANSPAARSALVGHLGPDRSITRSSRTAHRGRSIRFRSNRSLRGASDEHSTANDRLSGHVARSAAPRPLRVPHRTATVPRRTESRTEARYQRGRFVWGPLPSSIVRIRRVMFVARYTQNETGARKRRQLNVLSARLCRNSAHANQVSEKLTPPPAPRLRRRARVSRPGSVRRSGRSSGGSPPRSWRSCRD